MKKWVRGFLNIVLCLLAALPPVYPNSSEENYQATPAGFVRTLSIEEAISNILPELEKNSWVSETDSPLSPPTDFSKDHRTFVAILIDAFLLRTPSDENAVHYSGAKVYRSFMAKFGEAITDGVSSGQIPEDLVNGKGTPQKIATFLAKYFKYETDRVQFGRDEYWQPPAEFLASHKGDCEDFALLAHTLLKMNGYKSYLVNIYSDLSAHTVVVFKDKETWNVMDVDKARWFMAEKFTDVFKKMNPFWQDAAIVSVSAALRQGLILKSFSKRARAASGSQTLAGRFRRAKAPASAGPDPSLG